MIYRCHDLDSNGNRDLCNTTYTKGFEVFPIRCNAHIVLHTLYCKICYQISLLLSSFMVNAVQNKEKLPKIEVHPLVK